MTDYLTAVRLYLLAQRSVTDQCDQRVFVMALPADEMEADAAGKKKMPRKCVVIVASPGEFRKGRHPIAENKIDLVCFGATDFEAAEMERPVAQALKDLNREVFGGVLLHNATVASSPMQARDPDTGWPAMRRQAIVRSDEREVA